jgi:hypothetical protein
MEDYGKNFQLEVVPEEERVDRNKRVLLSLENIEKILKDFFQI